MATIRDIANRLGISLGTVSKGLHGADDISEELRQQILDVAVEMGYITKKMKKEKSKKLCLFIENMDYTEPEHFGYDIVLGFRQAAYREHHEVIVYPITPAFQQKEKYDTFMLKKGYAGGFFVGFSIRDEWLAQANSTVVPTVLFDNLVKKNPNVSYVGTDSFEGIDDAIDHLAGLNHRKIAFLNGSLYSMITEHRQQAFYESMAAHGIEVDERLIVNGHYVSESAKYFMSTFLECGATAILCGNDLIAYGVMKECEKRKLVIPDDISVIGFDDIPLSAQMSPPLTTIRQERLQLGRCGYFTLNSLLNQVPVSKTLLRPKLMCRKSTGRCHERI